MKIMNRRECTGPRGGRVILPTSCSDCVSYRTCQPGAITEPWGCESWVDDRGHRAEPEVIDLIDNIIDAARDVAAAEDPLPCLECGGLASECRACGCPHAESPDLGPLFGGRS